MQLLLTLTWPSAVSDRGYSSQVKQQLLLSAILCAIVLTKAEALATAEDTFNFRHFSALST